MYILGLVPKDNNDSIHNNYFVSDIIISGIFSQDYFGCYHSKFGYHVIIS